MNFELTRGNHLSGFLTHVERVPLTSQIFESHFGNDTLIYSLIQQGFFFFIVICLLDPGAGPGSAKMGRSPTLPGWKGGRGGWRRGQRAAKSWCSGSAWARGDSVSFRSKETPRNASEIRRFLH